MSMCWAPGTTEPGGGERQGGGTKEEFGGEGEDDSQSAREPARAVGCAAPAGGFQQKPHHSCLIDSLVIDSQMSDRILLHAVCLYVKVLSS